MALQILLVEDDPFFRTAIKGLLSDNGHTVTEAGDGRIARDVIKVSKPFDVVISDVQMPHLGGIELLQWVKENKPTPFILMTGFSLIMETKKAHELGADDFLAKPFTSREMIEALKRVVASQNPENEAKPDPNPTVDYCKVSLDEFVSSSRIEFDVYVKLGERYVMIGRKGEEIPLERIQNYKQKGLRYLYVLRSEFKRLLSFNLKLVKTIAGSSRINAGKKANFMRYTSEILLEKAFVSGVNEESFAEAKDFVGTALDLVSDDKVQFDLLESLNANSDRVYAHCLCVSLYSVMIAKQMGWTSASNLMKLSLAGLYIDIGKKEIDPVILNKPRSELTQDERQQIESHPQRGREILLDLKNVPTEVIFVVYEHHEDQLGTGYPRRIDKKVIHPYAQIARVADLFAELVISMPDRKGLTSREAIDYIYTYYEHTVNADALTALKQLFSAKKANVA